MNDRGWRFALALYLALTARIGWAQVQLLVHGVPDDGLVVSHVDLTNAAEWCKVAVDPQGVKAREGETALPVQFVPDIDFDARRNANGLLVMRLPRGGDSTVELAFDAAPPSKESWDGTVKSAGTTFVHDVRRQSGFPCEIRFADGKRFDSLRWNDRLHHRQLGSASLNADRQAKLERVSSGPLCTVVRVRSRFLFKDGKLPESSPSAVYDWVYLNDRPLVQVRAAIQQGQEFAWNEIHTFEMDYPGEQFPKWIGGEPRKEGTFQGTKKVFHLADWGAVFDGPRTIGMFQSGQVMLYDGGPGTYIQAHGDVAWQGFDKTRCEASAWLWIGSDPEVQAKIAKLAKTSVAPTVIVTVKPLQESLAKLGQKSPKVSAPQSRANWWRSIGARQLERQGRLREAFQVISGGKPNHWTLLQAGPLGMIIERNVAGLEVASLYDAAAAESMLAPQRCPLFEINLEAVSGGEKLKLDAATGWSACSVKTGTASEADLYWESPTDKRLTGLRVTARVVADPAGDFRWQFAVTGVPSAWSVVSVRFPQIALAEPGPNASLLFPRGAGEVQTGAWRRAVKLGGTYPSGWTSMPLLAAYDQAGTNGLYFAIHDPWGSNKEVHAESRPHQRVVQMWYEHPAPNAGLPGNGFELSGEAVWHCLDGDWFDAAMIYRDWARKSARWYPRLGPDGRSDTPLWMRELSAWAQTGGSPKECAAKVKGFAEFLGVPIGFHWYSWHQIPFDNDYPHYFPTKPGFADAVRDLQASGVYVMPYINGRLWDTRDRGQTDYQFTSVALPAATKDREGKPCLESYSSKEADGSPVKLAAMCPATKLWQDKVREIVLRLFEEQGVKGVYIDQVAAAQPRLCYDRAHGHPLAGGHWWTESYWAMLEAVRRAKPPDCMLTTECNAEPYAHVFDGYLTWHWQYDGQVPLSPAVYGSAIQMFGRAYRGGPTKDLALQMKAGQQLAWGEQIGWLDPTLAQTKENGPFFRQVVRLRHALRRYFYAGEMARPPRIEGDIPNVTADWQWHGEWPVTAAALQVGAWRIPSEKKLVLIFVNVSDAPIAATLEFDADRYGLPAGPLRMARVTSEGAGPAEPVERTFKKPFTAAPREAWAWEISF